MQSSRCSPENPLFHSVAMIVNTQLQSFTFSVAMIEEKDDDDQTEVLPEGVCRPPALSSG